MAACRLTIEWKLPRRVRRRVSAGKNVSTAFSRQPEGEVKWNQRVPGERGFHTAKSGGRRVRIYSWNFGYSATLL
jgi:hypothetical protein